MKEERQRLDKEISRLTELQSSLKEMEYNAKEKYERERLELVRSNNERMSEMDSLKMDYRNKLTELDYEKRILQDEKSFFEKFKDESLKNIEIKQLNLEDKKKSYYIEEKEMKKRIKILQEKEYFLKDKYEEYGKYKKEIIELKKAVDVDKKSLLSAAKRLEHDVKIVEVKNHTLEKEKEIIIRKFQEYESERSALNNERIRIEQMKSELKLRMQSIDVSNYIIYLIKLS